MLWNTAPIISLILLAILFASIYIIFTLRRFQKERIQLLKQNELLPILDHLPGMVFRCKNDTDWTFLFANQGAFFLTGHKATNLIQKKMGYLSFIHPENQETARRHLEEAMETKTALSQQFRIITNTGEIKWVHAQGRGTYSKQGTPLFFEGTIKDISQEKQDEVRHQIMKKISTACLQASHHEPMLEEVLQLTLKVFNTDRAWLIQASSVESEGYRIIKIASQAHLATTQVTDQDLIPINPARCQQILASEGVLKTDSQTAWPREDPRTGNHQAMICTAIKTKMGKPWIFGMHYDKTSHFYSEDETALFSEIACQLKETLSSLLSIKKLSKSDYILTEAQRISHIGVWNLDIVDNRLTWSDEIYRIFGLQKKHFEATYEAFLKLVHPDDRKAVDQAYTQSVINKTAYNITHRLLWADGTIRYVNEQCETFYDDSGRAVRSFGIVQDITHQKEVEAKLHRSLVAVNHTEDAVAVMNDKNEIIEVNAAYSKITGYARKEVLGRKTGLLRSGKHADSFYDLQIHDLEGKGMWQGEVWKRRKNGELFPTWATITTVRDPTQKIVNYVSVFSDVSPLKISQKKRIFFAHHDPLTNLPNRILFKDRLDHALQHSQREKKQLAVIVIGLDYFQKINERLGHPLGDVVLKQVSQRIKKSVRDEDTVARLEGDQFAILIEKMNHPQDIAFLVKNLKTIFEAVFVVNEHEMRLSVSVGISLYPEDAQDSKALLENATEAMSLAKEEGRNKFQFATPSLSIATFEHLRLEKALHQALAENELVLHYQARYSLKTDQVTNAEALVRWNHPEFGLLFPDKFIPFAEEFGLMQNIEQWVLETACAQMEAWVQEGQMLKRVAVNISKMQFQRADILTWVSQTLQKTGLSADHLELEITEDAIMDHVTHSISVLDHLAKQGVHITIDNFGTGYSSISYLNRLAIHRLKIDRSFVQDLPESNKGMAVTRTIKTLGESLQIAVIAEGVETKAQHQFLQALGCDEAQGYLYHRPTLGDPSASFLVRQ